MINSTPLTRSLLNSPLISSLFHYPYDVSLSDQEMSLTIYTPLINLHSIVRVIAMSGGFIFERYLYIYVLNIDIIV